MLYIGNINFNSSKEELSLLFSQFGEVKKVNIPRDKRSKLPIGYAFIEFINPDADSEAIKYLDKAFFGGRELAVSLSKQK